MYLLAAQLNPTLGDIQGNTQKVLAALQRAKEKGAELVLFPELTLSGYFPDDLLLDKGFIQAINAQLEVIRPETKGLFAVVGLPRKNSQGKEKPLLNSAAVFADGKLLGYQDKILLPTYDVFDERRYFEPGKETSIWEYQGRRIAITLCEDVWQHAGALEGYADYRVDPVELLQEKKPDLLLNLSASPYFFRRSQTRLMVFQKVARTLQCPVILCNQVGGNDQLIFDGHSLFLDERGELRQIAKGFKEDDLWIDLKVPQGKCSLADQGIKELYQALVVGVRDYFHKQGFQKGLVGLSGGIDSALVACIGQEALGAENMLALTLPSRFSSQGSVTDSRELAQRLGIEVQEISIEPLYREALQMLEPLFRNRPFNQTEENLQTRIRSLILMAFANKFGYLLLNTGNKSEMALGYCTLYGDMAGALGVLQDVTKTQVYQLAKQIGIIPEAILQKVPSAELKENQTDFEVLPPFEVLDPILEDYLEERRTPEEIAQKHRQPLSFVQQLIHKIHLAEYKRRQAPIGLRVTSKAFSKGRMVPIVQKWR